MGILYQKNGDVIEITIRDATRKKMGSWKMNVCDTELCRGVFNYLQRKYGFEPTIKPAEFVKENKEEPVFWK